MEMLPMLTWLACIVGLLVALPRVTQWLRQHRVGTAARTVDSVSVIAAAAVGPQQRVVTVQVQGNTLVLGVTAQHINCLHVLPATPQAIPDA